MFLITYKKLHTHSIAYFPYPRDIRPPLPLW
nr:MAG TPA: hypothetical protein [Caudoviricetes sp.]